MTRSVAKKTLEKIRSGADFLRAIQRSMVPLIILLSSLYVTMSGWFVEYVIGPVLLGFIVCGFAGLFLTRIQGK